VNKSILKSTNVKDLTRFKYSSEINIKVD